MGGLDQLDLTLKLSKAEESETLIEQVEIGMRRRGFERAPGTGEERVPS